MNDFKRNDRFGGGKRAGGFGKKDFSGGRPSFGGKPAFQRSGGTGFNRPQLPMFPATCANCGKATEVPFRPDGQRPIYCRDCLGGNKTSGTSFAPRESRDSRDSHEFPKRDFQKPAFHAAAPAQASKPDPRIDEIQGRLAKVLVKLDQILLEIAVAKAQAGAEAAAEVAATPKAPKKKTSKKK